MPTSRHGVAFLATASAMVPPRLSRRVAVIGGGSSGVVAARYLLRAGHSPEIFEAGSSFGGVWAERPTNQVVYKNLQTNLPTCVMQSPDLDFPEGMPSYVTKPQLGAYIERYANAFGVSPLARFGAAVTSVSPLAEDRWEVRWTSGGDGACHVDTFDAVIVCNGHYETPYKPALPGERQWLEADPSRSILHSREYDEPSVFRDRVVLVVGGRSSGVDIARELRGVAQWVYVLEKKCAPGPHTVHSAHTVHLPRGALPSPCTVCGAGARRRWPTRPRR